MRLLPVGVLALALTLAALSPGSGDAGPAAPDPASPPTGSLLEDFSPTLRWINPPGATQYQIQVTPWNDDGPGVNLIRALEDAYTIPPPTPDEGNYIMLPDMTYTWRVRASDAPGPIGETDGSWGPWSETRTFRTPPPRADLVRLVAPQNGVQLAAQTVTVQWDHASPHIFYYELQVSPDSQFRTGDAAVAPVWWNLVHGGVTQPRNSWTTPALESGVDYYWRVRPRVQGDGTPTDWSTPYHFSAIWPPPCCRVTVSFDNTQPLYGAVVRVTGRLTDHLGAPIAGAPMKATWRYTNGPWITCTGPVSDADGRSSCTERLKQSSGRVVVAVQFTYLDQVWSETGSVTPR